MISIYISRNLKIKIYERLFIIQFLKFIFYKHSLPKQQYYILNFKLIHEMNKVNEMA